MSESVKITTTGKKEHSRKKDYEEIEKFIDEYQNSEVDDQKIKEVVDSIVCKYIHEKEIFIASDKTVWPCCFMWDIYFRNKDNVREAFEGFEDGWNSLSKNSMDEILDHPWFKQILSDSWDPRHERHIPKCIRTCAKNKAYHNEINYVKNTTSK